MKAISRGQSIVLLTIYLLAIVAGILPTGIQFLRTPPNTTFSFTHGHTGDYYQLLHFVRQGMNGHLLFDMPYTTRDVAPILMCPVYMIGGMVMSPFTRSPIVAFEIVYVLSLGLFFFCLILLIHTTVKSFITKILALILCITATSFWTVSVNPLDITKVMYQTPIDWNDSFNVLRRLQLSPHHYLAISCLMLLCISLTKNQWNKKTAITQILLTLGIGVTHTYHLLLAALIAVVVSVFRIRQKPAAWKRSLLTLLPKLLPALLLYLYYAYATAQTYPWLQASLISRLFTFRQSIPFHTYISALGPLAYIWLLVLIPLVKKKLSAIHLILIAWAVIPALIFQFIDIGIMQPFKTHQYIPLALLTATGIEYLVSRVKIAALTIPFFLGATLIYGALPYSNSIQTVLTEHQENVYTTYIPDYLWQTFAYLDRGTPDNSYVLAGQTLSFMIPAFTDNRVIIGQGDSVEHYPQAVSEVIAFFNQTQTPSERRLFLRVNRIAYIIYGVDSPPFVRDGENESYLIPVYTNGFSTIVKVDFSQLTTGSDV